MTEAGGDPVIAGLRAEVDRLLQVDWHSLPPLKAAGLVSEIETQRRRLAAVDVHALAALSAQATPAEFGATSVPDLIGCLTRVTRGEARARAQRSIDLAPRRSQTGEVLPPIHPRTADALTAGEVSPEHVDVITRYLGRIPADVAHEAFDAAEGFLVHAAQHEDPGTLRRSGDLLLARLDPDGQAPRADEADRARWFTIGGRRGANSVHGRLSDEAKAVWQVVLDSLAAPQPASEGGRDERSAGQRGHDALLEAGLRLLRSGSLPDVGGTPVSVVVRVEAADLTGASRGEPGGVAQTGHGDVLALDRCLRLADQAEITTVLLTTRGGIVDYGRERRCASPGQRRALTARDGGCSFPGCTRPAAWTEAHHIRAWIDGGRTSLDNLCLLCAHHHRTFDSAGWAVVMTDGVPYWIPPAWLDPDRQPRRNTAHHLPEIDFASTDRAG